MTAHPRISAQAEAVDRETLLELDDAGLEALLCGLGLRLGERARLKNRVKLRADNSRGPGGPT